MFCGRGRRTTGGRGASGPNERGIGSSEAGRCGLLRRQSHDNDVDDHNHHDAAAYNYIFVDDNFVNDNDFDYDHDFDNNDHDSTDNNHRSSENYDDDPAGRAMCQPAELPDRATWPGWRDHH